MPFRFPPIEVFICPSDQMPHPRRTWPALSYSANSGAGTATSSGDFLSQRGDRQGDTADNGVFFNLADYERNAEGAARKSRIGTIKDGAAHHAHVRRKHPQDVHARIRPDPPLVLVARGCRRHFPGTAAWHGLGRDDTRRSRQRPHRSGDASTATQTSVATLIPRCPRFARPAGAHGSGVNVAFCDGHSGFRRDRHRLHRLPAVDDAQRPQVRRSDRSQGGRQSAERSMRFPTFATPRRCRGRLLIVREAFSRAIPIS